MKGDRRPWIGGNWKMHKTVPEALAFAQGLLTALPTPLRAEVVIAAPFTALYPLAQILKGGLVGLAGQDMHWEVEGAFTGEISGKMLKDAGCSYCLIGHSERRHLFGETEEQVARKVKAALAAGLRPVLCLGETLAERDAGRVEEVVRRQLHSAVDALSDEEMLRLVVAYEPVWAIGTGRSATPAAAQEVHAFIRVLLKEKFNKTLANEVRIVYGGSVTPENIADLYAQEDIDGGLIGGASLQTEKFLPLIREVNK
jgi:triosephosphate isomerase